MVYSLYDFRTGLTNNILHPRYICTYIIAAAAAVSVVLYTHYVYNIIMLHLYRVPRHVHPPTLLIIRLA